MGACYDNEFFDRSLMVLIPLMTLQQACTIWKRPRLDATFPRSAFGIRHVSAIRPTHFRIEQLWSGLPISGHRSLLLSPEVIAMKCIIHKQRNHHPTSRPTRVDASYVSEPQHSSEIVEQVCGGHPKGAYPARTGNGKMWV